MKRKKIYIAGLFCLFLLLLVSSCEHDTNVVPGQGQVEVPDEKVQIEIFTRASSHQLPSTRANETNIEMTPWVLVFKGQGSGAVFVEAVQAFEMANKRYVILNKQPLDNKYQLLILANTQNQFYYGDATVPYIFNKVNLETKLNGVTLGIACEKLLTTPLSDAAINFLPYSGANETIPMSYLLEVDKIDNTTKIATNEGGSLMLIRTLAKIVVVNTESKFELQGVVSVMNVPRQGKLHNLIDGSVMDNTGSLTEYMKDETLSILAEANDISAGRQSTVNNPIYLYESDIQNGTSVIIKGKYDSDQEASYYKMMLVDKSWSYMDILRNREYTFTITKVTAKGYETLDDAKISKASNIDINYEITVDDSDSYEIIANNDYFLGVSNSVFIAYNKGTAESEFEAFKLITDCEKTFPTAGIAANSSDVDGAFSLAYPNDGKIPIVTGLSPRTTAVGAKIESYLIYYEEGQPDKKNAYLTLKLGNLEKQVHIRQRNAVDATGVRLTYGPTGYIYPDAGAIGASYFCLTGQVVDGNDNPQDWIKLRPSSGAIREDTDRIIVEDGYILIDVLENSSGSQRAGIVYLATITPESSSPDRSTVKRIKIYIIQKG